MDTKQQWTKPAETLDAVIGILTGLPITETWGMDAIGTAQDVMREVMELRTKANALSAAEARIAALEAAARLVIADCEVAGVEPIHLNQLRELV